MSTIDRLSERGTSLVTHARQALGSCASSLPKLLEAGAMLGVAKTGLRAATTLARRAITLGVVGAGVLAYRFHRRRVAAKAQATPATLTVHRNADRPADRGDDGEDAQATGRSAKARARKPAGAKAATRTKSASRDA